MAPIVQFPLQSCREHATRPFRSHCLTGFFLSIGTGLALQLLTVAGTAHAQAPEMISFQGQVKVDGIEFNGTGHFKFALVDGGNLIERPPLLPLLRHQTYWSHDGTSRGGSMPSSSVRVPVTNGLYHVMLGDINVEEMTETIPSHVFTNSAVYLRIWFNDGRNGIEQLRPDQRIASVGYALIAAGTPPAAITGAMLADGAVSGSKIKPGSIDVSLLDDGGEVAYGEAVETLSAFSQVEPLPFSSLTPVSANNPMFSFALDGVQLGTVEAFVGSEALSEIYHYVVNVSAAGAMLDPDLQVGRQGTLEIHRNGRSTSFRGVISGCSVAARGQNTFLYTFRLEPPAAYLNLSQDYQIFQDRSVSDIITEIYSAAAGSFPTMNLSGTYPPREYIVQYRETDFNFVSRLMEEEGIFYFFDSGDSQSPMILADNPAAYRSLGAESIPYLGQSFTNPPSGLEFILSFQRAAHESTRTSTLATRRFQQSSVRLQQSISNPNGRGEVYEYNDYPNSPAELETLAQTRQQRLDVDRMTMFGAANAPDLRAGYVFSLDDRTGAGLNNSYLITSVRHSAYRRVRNGTATYYYGNEFQVIPKSLVYRPKRTTPKPKAQSVTGIVTGPLGETRHTDEFGRVKVRFHWDRSGVTDETSSAWIRVATPMAGSRHGMFFLPEVDDEVVVSFLNGDPRRPVIIGSVYNSEAMPPFSLPDNKFKSGIRSTSTAGGGVNEIIFDDTSGAESLSIHGLRLNLGTSGQSIQLDDDATMQLSAPEIHLATPQVLIEGRPYTPNNAIVAWAKVESNGTFGNNAFGVQSITIGRTGAYAVRLQTNLQSASVLIPIAVAEVKGQPVSQAALRLASVDQVQNNSFNVYINTGDGTAVNHPFVIIVTGR